MHTLSKVRKADHRFTMGIEIECCISINQWRKLNHKYSGFFYAGDDMSILADYDEAGVEFVSQPLSVNWLEKEIKNLYSKYPWTFNNSCGIHIHVNNKWLNKKGLKKIREILVEFRDDLDTQIQVFGRQRQRFCQIPFGNSDWDLIGRTASLSVREQTYEFRMFSSGDLNWALYCVRLVEWMVNNWKSIKVSRLIEKSQELQRVLGILTPIRTAF